MTEVMFYHLTETPLDDALPRLVERTLARDWRATIKVSDEDQCEQVDMMLWTHDPISFLPHGRDGDMPADVHPVFVTAGDANVNEAEVCFCVGAAAPPDQLTSYARLAVLFDGNDPHALGVARAQWSALKAAGHDLTYWKQNLEGGWQKAG